MTTKEKAIDKIRKLLELAKSPNEHEAALAAAQAAKIMVEHQVVEAELSISEPLEDVGKTALDSSGRMANWKGTLAYGCAGAAGCDIYYSTGWETTIVLVGPESAVDTVKYMYQYLVKEINRLADLAWREAKTKDWDYEYVSGRTWKNSFRCGAASTISSRLLATRREVKQTSSETALIRVDQMEKRVKDFMNALNLGTRRNSSSSMDYDAYSSGSKAGRDVNLGGNKGLNKAPKMLGA